MENGAGEDVPPKETGEEEAGKKREARKKTGVKKKKEAARKGGLRKRRRVRKKGKCQRDLKYS